MNDRLNTTEASAARDVPVIDAAGLVETLANATRGPWRVETVMHHEPAASFELSGENHDFPAADILRYEIISAQYSGQAKGYEPVIWYWMTQADADLIAMAPNLAAEVIRLTAELVTARVLGDAMAPHVSARHDSECESNYIGGGECNCAAHARCAALTAWKEAR